MASTAPAPAVGFSAGCIVRRSDGAIALVGGRLPVAEQSGGEALDATAARVLRGDLGLNCSLGGFAGTTTDSGCICVFWNVTAPDGAYTLPTVEWLQPEAAAQRLTSEAERALVAKPLPTGTGVHLSMFTMNLAAKRRLRASINAIKPELEYRASIAVNRSWCKPAQSLVQQAEAALRDGALGEGWRCLVAAERLSCYGMGPAEIQARVTSTLEASDKITGWRSRAVKKLLSGVITTPAQLTEAMALLDEAAYNQWYKIDVRRWHLTILLVVLLAVLSVLISMAFVWGIRMNSAPAPEDWRMLALAALLGAAGASLTAILSVARSGVSDRIPEQIVGSGITMLRPAIGAAGAIAAFLLMQSGFIDFGPLSTARVSAIAFAAGFSEHLVVKGLESVATKA
jgi:hypothetical protein